MHVKLITFPLITLSTTNTTATSAFSPAQYDYKGEENVIRNYTKSNLEPHHYQVKAQAESCFSAWTLSFPVSNTSTHMYFDSFLLPQYLGQILRSSYGCSSSLCSY